MRPGLLPEHGWALNQSLQGFVHRCLHFVPFLKNNSNKAIKLSFLKKKKHCSAGSSESVEQVMDQVEKYIMSRLYKTAFCPETTDDERKDLAIQKRIRWAKQAAAWGTVAVKWLNLYVLMNFRALHWVTIQMLCVPIDEEIPEVSDKVVNAITGQFG